MTDDLERLCLDMARRAKAAAAELTAVTTDRKNAWLLAAAG